MNGVKRQRLVRRLWVHHLPIALASLASIAVLYVTRPYKDVISKASFATAYPALVLIGATLVIGPWNLLRGIRTPASSDLRRDLGIWAGIIGVVHSVVGQMVHLRGRFWLYYVYEHPDRHAIPLRHDLFGFANFTGLLGVITLVVLLATSNDYSLRALGTPRWKQLQRWNYLAFLMVAAHTIAYQTSEKQKAPFVVAAVASIAITAILQGMGFARRRAEQASAESVAAG
jgi:sulfoxide reductase heme-binding subunit YedZ